MTTIDIKQPVTITTQAAESIRGLLTEKALTDHCLRIYVAGIGCSGPQYGLAFDGKPRETDVIVESEGVKMLIDPNSLAYLEGATIDYVETAQGSGFRIENPNPMAAAACGTCGGGCG